ncbi:hypothetical protein EG329_011752 [Mollisiaceae sp. DMI_Dod_QoI]|nr:hypothetical protein EG329_011752 [Helotiales sp. DMI_Dod_QoI]
MASSLTGGSLESIAHIIKEARANPSAILDSLNSHSRNLASSVSDTFKDAKQDPSAVLDSFEKRGQNVLASLSTTAKEFQSKKKIIALTAAWWIPFTATIVVLYLFGGFGRAGVRGSSLASWFQSRRYGGYTPKGGFFANSTSASMRGNTPMVYKVAAVAVASAAVVAVYRSRV